MEAPTIIVCIKAIPDPEGPRSAFELRCEEKKVVPVGIPPVINPYDENALEVAVTLKEHWGGKVIAVNMSEKASTPVLKKALSVGADELILLEDPLFKASDLTSASTATILAAAIQKIGEYDLVLTGRHAADWDSGQVGLLIAEILHIPGINLAQKVVLRDNAVTVERLKRQGYEVLVASTPALITVSSEAGDLRLPTLKAIQGARKKPVTVWRAADLEIEEASVRMRNIVLLRPPSAAKRNCAFIDGDSAYEKGENLALKLRADRVI
ncbi:MAG: Acryloyl-CoA reductase electron transfer subunit gamma [Syntrophorhabdus sp. PtaU1.Bin050]|nr:MAG: Acryloyl-CoA reductase electron transfer subunit gamma [Syntrophorhabdus sp. PtaU1.Bin050]